MDNLYLPIPKDFVVSTYRKLNKDIHDYNDMECRIHYIVIGKKEGRAYNIKDLLPADFLAESYVEYNVDLTGMSELQLQEHYVLHGKKEQRIYSVDLPDDFDVEVYRYMNRDIFDQTDGWLKRHYYQHGQYEQRIYSDRLYDKSFFINYNNLHESATYADYLSDIRQIKSQEILDIINSTPDLDGYLLLVSHDNSIYGATHYLYLLFEYLRSKNFKVKILDADFNPMLKEKYAVSDSDILYYKKDATLLYHICVKANPRKIFFNSMSFPMAEAAKYLNRERLIIHSHEVRPHYICSYPPDFVVANTIAEQYEELPKVQPPIISNETLKLIDIEFAKQSCVKNYLGELQTDKITIGMCGSLTTRKNYKLFIELAENLKQFNFLWVGGHQDVGEDVDNFYHVKNVELPYRYYNLMDYFILCSTEDPCPYVVLENLYVGNKVLTFEKNIYTRHDKVFLTGQLFEFPGEISYENAYKHIVANCKSKKTADTLNYGRDYILNNYVNFKQEYLATLLHT
jgi:glycosyltransferase involved in cell wall biosynthesis